ncbi:Dam Site-specific DNA methylase [actinobacterium SCGC AAA044-D11]
MMSLYDTRVDAKTNLLNTTDNLIEKPPAPFLRWAGGKRRLVPVITTLFSKSFDGKTNKFHEPFVGGGSLMLALGDENSPHFVPGRNLYISDSNPDLINTYIVIRDDIDSLIRELRKLSKDVSKESYDSIRLQIPRAPIKRAARLIYLNKTCFNGIWRVNGSGKFNVPWGKLKNPKIYDESNLRSVSARLKGSKIMHSSFSSSIKQIGSGDLVYFDPPYIPLSKSASFSSYAKEGFGINEHEMLANLIGGLEAKGAFVLLSNSDTPATREIFGNSMYLYNLDVSRSISANSSSRKPVKEIIASNYKIHHTNLHFRLKRIN